MEKRNVVEQRRTPCKAGNTRFCECPECTAALYKKSKEAEVKPLSINDTEGLARMQK